MRSHPYKAPPPLPPMLDDLATYLPNSDRRRSSGDDSEVPLSEVDPESGRLLPKRPRQHRVRVQGKLALVRSVSVADLRLTGAAGGGGGGSHHLPSPSPSPSPRTAHHRGAPLDSGVGCAMPRRGRRHSVDDTSDTDEETSVRDTQPRGYGIGGAGNIRRPTEVMGRPTRSSPLLAALLSPSYMPRTSPLGTGGGGGDKKKWNIREFLGKVSDRRGKGKGPVVTEE